MPTLPPSALANGEVSANEMPASGKRRQPHDESGDGDRESKRSKTTNRKIPHGDYTIAWICALHIERAAAEAMLDEIHVTLPGGSLDTNFYTMGNIGPHNIVIACLPAGHYGTNNAALVGKDINRSFPSIKFRFMVGIGGGAPKKVDIRLGDIAVSIEVLQHDFGRTLQSGFQRTGNRVKPPQTVMKAVSKLRAQHERQPSAVSNIISDMLRKNPGMASYARPSQLTDRLFESTCGHTSSVDSCQNCDHSKLVHRTPRRITCPEIHYGVIASGNQVIKDAETRDSWSANEGVICFEMESAGLMDDFPCLVIRGICDYSDSHKSKEWQQYASATSAAYTKELLSILSTDMDGVQSLDHTTPQNQIRKSLTQYQRQVLLDSLKFDQIDARRLTIKNAYAKTCKWILKNSKFRSWQGSREIEAHHGFLWIKGKPGAGKSTLMKFILQDFHKMTNKDDKQIVINFFFNARGEHLEKSTIGMYRSLLVQLFEHIPALECALDAVGLTNWSPTRPPDWNIETLEECFKQAVQILGDYSVVCLIDALDECDQTQIREMLDHLECICGIAFETRQKFLVCLSSRHYPHITINFGQNFVLEGQEGHEEDIANYIHSKLNIGHSKKAEEIRTELQEKASGVFMWVVLVVDILRREHDGGRVHAMRKRLKEIPGDLNDLFRDIIRRHRGNENELLLCLQWVLFARVPLKPQELYFAIRSGIDGDDEALEKWDPEEISIDDMQRFIVDSSKGLVEVTKSKSATVQFIHESVRDFLRTKDGFTGIWPQIDNIEGQSHEKLKQCCLKYSLADACCWNVDERLSKADWDENFQSVVKWFPFLKYSVRNLLFHADKAAGYGIPQQEFIQKNFNLDRWIRLHNTMEKHNTRRYEGDTRLLYVLAEANTGHLILASSLVKSCLEIKKEWYGCPLLAAIVSESFDAVSVFRAALIAPSPPPNTLKILTSSGTIKSSKLSRDFKFSANRSLLSHMAEYGDTALFTSLLEANTEDPNLRDKDTGRTLLSWAIMKGHQGVVETLLRDQRINPDLADNAGQTPLSWAARHGREEAIRILLDKEGIDLNARDNNGRTPLSWAASTSWSREAVCAFFDKGGVDLNSRDNDGRTPLSWAASDGSLNIISAFLKKEGIDLNSRDNNGRTPLSWAASSNRATWIISAFLDKEGIDLNSCDDNGRTPSSWAVEENSLKEVIQILLNAEGRRAMYLHTHQEEECREERCARGPLMNGC